MLTMMKVSWRNFKERNRMGDTLICWHQKCKITQFTQKHKKIKNKWSKYLNKSILIMNLNR